MDSSLYREVERRTIQNFNLRCIDGSIHGCNKCIGYCSYEGHAGFLTPEIQKKHQCIEKGCFYHYPKPTAKKRSHNDNSSFQQKVFLVAQAATAAMEGLRVIRVVAETSTSYVIYYAAIAKYDISSVTETITARTECQICMRQIPCDFNIAAALVMS